MRQIEFKMYNNYKGASQNVKHIFFLHRKMNKIYLCTGKNVLFSFV